jgi:hypothetical protein
MNMLVTIPANPMQPGGYIQAPRFGCESVCLGFSKPYAITGNYEAPASLAANAVAAK